MLGVTTGAVYFGHFTRNVLLLGENSDAAGVQKTPIVYRVNGEG